MSKLILSQFTAADADRFMSRTSKTGKEAFHLGMSTSSWGRVVASFPTLPLTHKKGEQHGTV